MKTYLLSTFDRLKSFSQKLDVRITLCGNSWNVLNDDGQSEVYVFKPDGTLYISVDGLVTKSTWQFLPVDGSLVIEAPSQSYMLTPYIFDNGIFVMQLQGTQTFSFLIEQNMAKDLGLDTYKALESYLNNKLIQNTPTQTLQSIEKQGDKLERIAITLFIIFVLFCLAAIIIYC